VTVLDNTQPDGIAGRGLPRSPVTTVLALSLLVLATAFAALPPVYRATPSPDELTWARRSLVPWWFPEPRIMDKTLWSADYRQKYTQCIHHPTLARIVYRTVLTAAGYDKPPEAVWKYGASYDENIRLGNFLPSDMRFVLRLTNAFFFAATVIVAYLGLALILRSRLLGVVASLPIVFEPTMRITYKAVVPYIGADAVFVFLLVLAWFLWLRVKDRPLASTLVLGIIGGLAVSTKVNGVFVLLAAAAYYCFSSRGWRRLAVPAGILSLSAAVFLALNPVYFGGGWPWAVMVFRDTLSLMFDLKRVTTATSWGSFTPFETISGTFPCWPLAVPVVAVIWYARDKWWFGVTFAWAASVILCNLTLIYMPQPRDAAPVRIAFFVLMMSAGLTFASAAPSAPQPASPGPTDGGQT